MRGYVGFGHETMLSACRLYYVALEMVYGQHRQVGEGLYRFVQWSRISGRWLSHADHSSPSGVRWLNSCKHMFPDQFKIIAYVHTSSSWEHPTPCWLRRLMCRRMYEHTSPFSEVYLQPGVYNLPHKLPFSEQFMFQIHNLVALLPIAALSKSTVLQPSKWVCHCLEGNRVEAQVSEEAGADAKQ